MKVLMQVISITTRRLFWARNGFWFYCGHRWKLHGTHQAVHSTDADTNAIVTTKEICDFISTDAFIVVSVNVQNHLFDVLILNGSGRRQRIKMFVISAAVYVEYTAEGFDIVLESKLINCT